MLTINFYNYKGNPKVIHKNIGNSLGAVTIEPYDFYNDQQPQILLKYNSTFYDSANYCKIGSDYYFIVDRALEIGGKMTFFLDKDVLKTHANEIDNTSVILDRSSSIIDSWMPDELQAHTVQKITQNYLLGDVGSGFTGNGHIVFVAVGSKDVIEDEP